MPSNRRVDPFPFRGSTRWLLRLALAAPYLAVAVISARSAVAGFGPNEFVYEHVLAVAWTSGDVRWLGQLYPPLGLAATAVVTRVVPLGPLGLSLLAALVAGYLLQKVLETMRQRGFPVVAIVFFLLALAVNPFTVYLVEDSALLFLALTFFCLGIGDMMRFLAWGSTREGFRAGVLFMLAVFSDVIGMAFVATAVVSSLFIPGGRREPGRRTAELFVIGFPTVGALASWFFIAWAFDALPIQLYGFLAGPANTARVVGFFTGYGGWLIIVPIASLWLIAFLSRRFDLVVVTLTVGLVYLLASFAGFASDPASAGVYFLLLSLLILYTPDQRPRTVDLVLPFIAVAQLVMVWVALGDNVAVLNWFQALRS